MPIVVNKLGEHKNEDAVIRLTYYMASSKYLGNYGGRGIMALNEAAIIDSFNWVKMMYDKNDRKLVNHFIIGSQNEGITPAQLYYIAEVASQYFYEQGYQNFYVIHKGSQENPKYYHIHLAVNTVNFLTGNRLYENYGVVSGLRKALETEYPEYSWSSINDFRKDWE